MACERETTKPITLEIAHTDRDGRPSSQVRARFDGMVITAIGEAQSTELAAFDVLTRALAAAPRGAWPIGETRRPDVPRFGASRAADAGVLARGVTQHPLTRREAC